MVSRAICKLTCKISREFLQRLQLALVLRTHLCTLVFFQIATQNHFITKRSLFSLVIALLLISYEPPLVAVLFSALSFSSLPGAGLTWFCSLAWCFSWLIICRGNS
jgi:hypothetical protein